MSDSAVPARASSAPVPAEAAFDVEADIVVVGGGGGGLPAALFARWLGDEVVLLEKAPELGGTAKKAAFWYWVPNNEPMRDAGIKDPKEDCLRYMRAAVAPERYDPDSPTFGLSEWEYAHVRAIYDSASPAAELLAERGALPYRHVRVRARLLGRAARGQGADRPRARARGRARGDVRRRRGRHPHDERGGRARRRRHPHRPSRAAARHRPAARSSASRRRRRRRRRVRVRRAQGGDLRHRRLHARRRAARELPLRAGLRRLRGAHQRGRLRPHRRAASARSCAT